MTALLLAAGSQLSAGQIRARRCTAAPDVVPAVGASAARAHAPLRGHDRAPAAGFKHGLRRLTRYLVSGLKITIIRPYSVQNDRGYRWRGGCRLRPPLLGIDTGTGGSTAGEGVAGLQRPHAWYP